MKYVDELQRRTIARRSDEPKLEIGDTISLKEGVVGVILARYAPSGTTGEVRYIVELRRDDKATKGAA